jgi:hypothetical protein
MFLRGEMMVHEHAITLKLITFPTFMIFQLAFHFHVYPLLCGGLELYLMFQLALHGFFWINGPPPNKEMIYIKMLCSLLRVECSRFVGLTSSSFNSVFFMQSCCVVLQIPDTYITNNHKFCNKRFTRKLLALIRGFLAYKPLASK